MLVKPALAIRLVLSAIMWLGTVGMPENMKLGDACEMEIAVIGRLRNPIVVEKPSTRDR